MGRVDGMHDVLAGHVERAEVPGVVTLLSRRGEVQVDAIGMKAVGGTEPITAAATMILGEEGKLRLDDPVDSMLPELARHPASARPGAPIPRRAWLRS
jgi:hypothetical protein